MPTIKNEADIQWKSIVKSIAAEKCILVIGNGLLFNKEGTNILEALKTKILLKLKKHSKNYQSNYKLCDLGFLIGELRDVFNGPDIWTDLRSEFLEGDPPNDLYQKIAEIPFSLILSTSPDNYLQSILKKMGAVQTDFLKHTGKKDFKIPKKISSKFPAIFSLFGNIDDSDSLVLDNYNTTTRLISSLYKGDNKLPPRVVEKINESTHCIFLGVNFDDWYTNILLDILNFNKHNTKKIWSANYAFSSRPEVDQSTEHFYEDNFKIGFICIKEFNIRSFVEDLYAAIKTYNSELLRTKSDNPNVQFQINIDIIKEDLVNTGNDDLMDIIDELIDLISRKDLILDEKYRPRLQEKLLVQKTLYVQNQEEGQEDLLTKEEKRIGFSKIRKELRKICEAIEKKINGR